MFARTSPGLFFALALAFGNPCFAETSTEVLQRMNSYRDNDAQDIQQRTETRAWQEIRRKEEYARTWKCYGSNEVNVARWRQLPDLTWITEIQKTLEGSHCYGSSKQGDEIGQSVVVRFGDTLRQIAQRTGLTISDLLRLNPGLEAARLVVGSEIRLAQPPNSGHFWVKVRSEVQLEELANQLSINEVQLARLNEVNEDHRFLSGDWLVLPAASSRKAKNLASLDTSALRRSPSSLASAVESSFVAINCAKLLIVQKPAYAPWGKWERPDDGSSFEKLVVDRCASKSPF